MSERRDEDWASKMREVAADLAAVKGSRRNVEGLLAAADMIDRAPSHARRRIAAALCYHNAWFSLMPRYGEVLRETSYPRARTGYQADIVLGKSPAESTGLTAREAHEYLSESRREGPAQWLIHRHIATCPATSVRDVRVARWLVLRWADPEQKEALLRGRIERGPAGEEIRGRFIDRVDELESGDLTLSVRETFDRASQRLRAEFEKEMSRKRAVLAPAPPWYTEQPGIELLNTGAKLVMEGRQMGHCVATYVGKVRKGVSMIVSVRASDAEGGLHRSTAELSVKTGQVLQHRGLENEPAPRAAEEALQLALWQWAENRWKASETR